MRNGSASSENCLIDKTVSSLAECTEFREMSYLSAVANAHKNQNWGDECDERVEYPKITGCFSEATQASPQTAKEIFPAATETTPSLL